ncbi:hypothetical protein [Asticcacaulis sp. AND118]|uniref:hypothetical protein n=1 Tax=Asticcacaulis sp. AND118 TaxID=2840468 RepID=UPI001CFF9DA7|nr:hypothetical protein [Asticcacaulis sp. AND118]UDF02583.1 hypothetical protein LH365_09060 [Asticcacaulis sp. AND118]
MSFGTAFHLIGALKAAGQALPLMWRRAGLVLAALFVILLLGHLPFLDMWVRRLLIVLGVIAHTAAAGALYRLVLFGERYAASEGLGFGGLQFGRPERRLLAASALVLLFWSMVFVTGAVVLALFMGAAGLPEDSFRTPHALLMTLINGPQPQGVVVALAIFAVLLILTILTVKLWLHRAATVAEHRVVSLNALNLSSGQTVKLFLGYAYILLPFIFLSTLMPSLAVVAGMPLGGVINLALGVVVFMPLGIAFLASAYRQISALRAKG